MKITALKHLLSVGALLIVISLCTSVLCINGTDTLLNMILTENRSAVKQKDQNKSKTVIIDAGHGGEDPGAVGINGSVEKDLNLDIARILKDALLVCGYSVVMTRDEDILLYNEGASGTKKAQDLKNRLEYTRLYPDALLVSIHMNKFSLESCHGLQIYYSGNAPESRALAESIRISVNERLMPDNTRRSKEATSSIYLMHRSQIPSVLVECGFLSNADEEKLLSDKDYRKRLAFAICNGIVSYGVSEDLIINTEE